MSSARVAADDGIMQADALKPSITPRLRHPLPIMVAINKIDLSANIDTGEEQRQEHGLRARLGMRPDCLSSLSDERNGIALLEMITLERR